MEETKHQPLFAVLREYPAVFRQIIRTPATLLTGGLLLVLSIGRMINGTFWSILVTEKLGIPAAHLALFSFARSVTMLLFFFVVMPKVRSLDERKPMMIGFTGLVLSQVLLISAPAQSYPMLLIAMILEACSIPLSSTFLQKLLVINVDAEDRARITAILSVVVLVCTSPFGWIAGRLSEMNRSLPFMLNVGLFGAGVVLTLLASRWMKKTAD